MSSDISQDTLKLHSMHTIWQSQDMQPAAAMLCTGSGGMPGTHSLAYCSTNACIHSKVACGMCRVRRHAMHTIWRSGILQRWRRSRNPSRDPADGQGATDAELSNAGSPSRLPDGQECVVAEGSRASSPGRGPDQLWPPGVEGGAADEWPVGPAALHAAGSAHSAGAGRVLQGSSSGRQAARGGTGRQAVAGGAGAARAGADTGSSGRRPRAGPLAGPVAGSRGAGAQGLRPLLTMRACCTGCPMLLFLQQGRASWMYHAAAGPLLSVHAALLDARASGAHWRRLRAAWRGTSSHACTLPCRVPGRPSMPCRCSAVQLPFRRCPCTSGLVTEGFIRWCQGLVCGISRLARGCSPSCRQGPQVACRGCSPASSAAAAAAAAGSRTAAVGGRSQGSAGGFCPAAAAGSWLGRWGAAAKARGCRPPPGSAGAADRP